MSFDYTQEDIEQFPEIITSYKKKIMFEKFLKDIFFALVEYNDTRKDLSYKRTPRDPHKIDFKYQVFSHHNELNYDTYVLEILIDKQPQSQMDIKLYDYSEALKIPFDKENLQKKLIDENTLWFGIGTKSYIMNGNLPSIRYFSVANKKFINKFVQNYNFGG